MKKTLTKIAAGISLAATSIFSLNSCEHLTEAAANQLLWGLGTHAAQEVISQEINPEQTNVYVNNSASSTSTSRLDISPIEGWLYIDQNGNDFFDLGEQYKHIPAGPGPIIAEHGVITYLSPSVNEGEIEYWVVEPSGEEKWRSPNMKKGSMMNFSSSLPNGEYTFFARTEKRTYARKVIMK